MIDSPPPKALRSQITKTVMLTVALSVSFATASACGQADESAAFESDGYEILGKSTQPTSTPTPKLGRSKKSRLQSAKFR